MRPPRTPKKTPKPPKKTPKPQTRLTLVFLTILFFGSGACALVYQVMWLRLLALVFGVTVYAASTVLASFMGGLAQLATSRRHTI